jgi:thiol-disulfide isomerase/thioredoxin
MKQSIVLAVTAFLGMFDTAVCNDIPSWACSMASAPRQNAGGVSGELNLDAPAADNLLVDARNTASNAIKLHNFAVNENKTNSKAAAADEADAQELIKEATNESVHADSIVAAVKAEAASSVTPVDSKSLGELADAKQDLLLVFYAPWCPTCQTFVMHDAQGNPEKAPLELLSKEFQAASGPKVVKWDVDVDRNVGDFDVEYIPTVYLVTSNGEKQMFKGDPHDAKALKQFAGVKAAGATFLQEQHGHRV